MNMKELEGRVLGIEQRMEQMSTVIDAQARAVIKWEEHANILDAVRDLVYTMFEDIKAVKELIGAEDADGPLYPEFKDLTAKVENLRKMVEGRNKSAPTKRNMTDADAIRVMTGDLKDASHKDAAEQANLTYAQVYSCRLEYTFKHVHKQLRDENKDFKNPWAK